MAQAADMLIRISAERTQPVAGSAATKGSDPRHFDGRLDLLRVISELVAAGGGDVAATDKPTQETETGSWQREVPIMIGDVTQVVIEVEDQERAKAFWTQTLGFELARDAPYGEERWLEVRTPDKAVVVVLDFARGRGRPRPTRAFRPPTYPAGACRAALRLVVAVRGPRRQQVRPDPPRPVAQQPTCRGHGSDVGVERIS